MLNDNFPFRALGLAIVHRAILDYIEAQNRMDSAQKSGSARRVENAEVDLKRLEGFFKSEWCSMLCEGFIDGDEILQKLKHKEWRYDDDFGYILCRERAG